MAQAIKLLDSQLAAQYGITLAVARIDVVMEPTTLACDAASPPSTTGPPSWYIRTGQPGMHPERHDLDLALVQPGEYVVGWSFWT